MMVAIMNRLRSLLQGAWPGLLIIAIASAAQLFLITRPLDFLLTHILPDDAFYYFEIAHNIALGLGSTFDGFSMTNGYHPLWMLILVPIFSIFGGDVGALEPIRAALALSVLLNAATGVLVWCILGRFTESVVVRSLGLALWSLNPFFLYESINGLETSLSLFFLALLFWAALRIEKAAEETSPDAVSLKHLLILGLVGGFSILARIDTVLFVGAILLWLWQRNPSRGLRQASTAGLVTFICIAPWLLWNYTNFGMILTSSAGATALTNHSLIYHEVGGALYESVKGVLYTFFLLHIETGLLVHRTGAPALVLMLFGAMVTLLLLSATWKLRWKLREVSPVYALIAGFLLLFLLNVGVRWTARPWFFVSFGFFVSIGAVLFFEAVRVRWQFGRRLLQGATLMLCGLLAFSFFASWYRGLIELYPPQREMYAAALWLDENLPDARIGVFNAGIIGYFSSAGVINLDGLVNNDAYAAMKERRLYGYLRDANIAHVADFPVYITYRYKSFWGVPDITAKLEEVHTIFLEAHNKSSDGHHTYRVR